MRLIQGHQIVLATTFLFTSLTLVPNASATTLDASNVVNPTNSFVGIFDTVQFVGQTFTAGRDGSLDRISVQVANDSAIADLTLEIRKTKLNGDPDLGVTGLLASTLIPLASIGSVSSSVGFADADFSGSPLSVTQGDNYAFTLTGNGYLAAFRFANPYPDGFGFTYAPGSIGFNSGVVDLGFQVFVQPIPEPSAIVLAAAGCVALLTTAARRRRLGLRRAL